MDCIIDGFRIQLHLTRSLWKPCPLLEAVNSVFPERKYLVSMFSDQRGQAKHETLHDQNSSLLRSMTIAYSRDTVCPQQNELQHIPVPELKKRCKSIIISSVPVLRLAFASE
jgi:hypothetical protein